MRKSDLAAVAILATGFIVAAVPVASMPLIRLAASEARTLERASPKTSATTSDYVRDAALGDRFEIAAAKVAEQRTRDRDVRNFARMMIRAHTATTDRLKDTLQVHDVWASLPPALDQQHTQMLQDLSTASVHNFDRRYMQQQVQAHEEALALHNTYAQSGDNKYLQRFAAQTASKVQRYLRLAHEIADRESRTASAR